MMRNLTLIIPAKFEKESLPIFLKEINKYSYKKIIVLKKSDKETINSLKKNKKNYKLLFQKGNGYGSAIIEGINKVNSKFCCIINADGSMNPKYLQQMLKLCSKKDLIFCSRYKGKKSGSSDDDLVTFIGNKIFSFLGNLLFSLNLSDILFTYILAKTRSLKKLNLKSKDFKLCIEIPIQAKKKNMIYSSIPCYERSRIGGKKKVNVLKDGLIILIYMIKLFFNYKK